MKDRMKLHSLLEGILSSENVPVEQVYFQPPTNKQMNYPAIRYSIDGLDNKSADDQVYKQSWYYKVTVIDKKSTSMIAQKVSMLPKVQMVGAPYVVDNLYHYVFKIYY